MDTMKMMDYFMLAIGVYIFYCGIRGKGDMMYKDDNIHRSQKRKYYKLIRMFGLTAGPLSIASAVLTLSNQKMISNIIAAIFGIILFYLIIKTYRMTDRFIKKRCKKLGVEEPPSDGWDEEHGKGKAAAVKEPSNESSSVTAKEPSEESSGVSGSMEIADGESGIDLEKQGDSRKVEQDDIRFF